MAKTTDRISELEEKLRTASEAYYNSGTTVMSDEDFDSLKKELQEADPDNAFLKEVGAPVAAKHLQKVQHRIAMGSLTNCTRQGDKANPSFDEWHDKRDRAEVCVMHKLDGSSIEVIYRDGKLVQAITRGDGFEGEDVTQNVRKFKNIPLQLATKWNGSVRGEAMLYRDEFAQYFKGESNPRNSANGTVRRSDGTLAQHLRFVAFDGDGEYKTHRQRLEALAGLGFEPVWFRVLTKTEDVMEIHQEQGNSRDSLPYEIDGLVVKVNDCEAYEALGERDNRPKGGVAFKFEAMGGATKLLGIKLSIGHTGAIIPTADLAPIQIGGVTVTSALLNNYDEIERLGIAINDEVRVVRRGDVIPKVEGKAQEGKDRKAIKPPTECIACKSKLEKVGVHWMCKSENCTGKNFRLLKSWVTKRGILYLGDTILEELYDKYEVKEPQDLYKLSVEKLTPVRVGNGILGASNAKRIMEQIDASRDCPLNEFVGSLGIEFLGRRQAEIMIGQGVDTLKKFLTLKAEELAKMEGFSGRKATAITVGLVKAARRMKALLDNGVKVSNPSKPSANGGGKLAGRSVCFTGVRPSKDEEAQFAALGGIVKSGVSKGLEYLVMANPSSMSNKAKKAREYGTKLIGYKEFQGWLK